MRELHKEQRLIQDDRRLIRTFKEETMRLRADIEQARLFC